MIYQKDRICKVCKIKKDIHSFCISKGYYEYTCRLCVNNKAKNSPRYSFDEIQSYRDQILEKIKKRTSFNYLTYCWECNYHKSLGGYPYINLNFRNERVSRIIYQIFKGPIEQDLLVLHKCDNPSCINPNHLFLGTSKDNSQDMVKKGRSVRGGKNPNAKMTEKTVLEIRELSKTKTGKEISEIYNINITTACKIIRRETWKHIV